MPKIEGETCSDCRWFEADVEKSRQLPPNIKPGRKPPERALPLRTRGYCHGTTPPFQPTTAESYCINFTAIQGRP